MLVYKKSQTWIFKGGLLSHQPIWSHVRKSLLTFMNFDIFFLLIPPHGLIWNIISGHTHKSYKNRFMNHVYQAKYSQVSLLCVKLQDVIYSSSNESVTLEWRHNERHGVSNHQRLDWLFKVCSGAGQRKYQSSASLAFVRGIHGWPVNSCTKGQ